MWKDKHSESTYLIEVEVPNTNNMEDTKSAEIHKYRELATEIKYQWF